MICNKGRTSYKKKNVEDYFKEINQLSNKVTITQFATIQTMVY